MIAAMADIQQESFDTRAAYLQAVDKVLSIARKDICIFDPDITALEPESRTRAETIAAFLAGGRDRSLRIVLHDLDHLVRYSPRLTALLRRYGHAFSIRQTPEPLRNLADTFLLADATSGVIRFHAGHFRGKLLLDAPREIHDWQQRFEELWGESIPGMSVTVLGL